MVDSEVCETCKFFKSKAHVSHGLGKCRRYPPVIVDSSSHSPVTDVGGWCGEYKHRVI